MTGKPGTKRLNVGLLTDQKNTPSSIAESLKEADLTDVMIYVGENLSYEDEVITRGKPSDILGRSFSDLVVVILEKE